MGDTPSGCSVFYRNNGGIVVHWNSNDVGDETWDNSWNDKRGVICKVDVATSPPTTAATEVPTIPPTAVATTAAPTLTFPPTTLPGVLPSVLLSVSPSAPPSDLSSVSPSLKPSPKPTCEAKTTRSCSEDADCACLKKCEKKPSKCKCLKNKCKARRWDCATKGLEHKNWKCVEGTGRECVPWYTKTSSTGTYVSKWGSCKKIQE